MPFLGVVLTLLAALRLPVIQIGVLLLMGGEIAIPDERTRLLWFGIVMAAAFVAAVLSPRTIASGGTTSATTEGSPEALDATAPLVAILGILVLRWIPFHEVLLWREIALLAIAAGIVWIYRATPLAIAIAVLVALITPAIPMRTLGLPLGVLVAGALLRLAGMPAIGARTLPAIAIALPMIFFAWSGVFARALPVLLRGPQPERTRYSVAMAPRPGESVTIDVPDMDANLIVSGANMPRLPRGTAIGRIEPGGRIIRVGDIADWGSFRREHYYAARNPLPRDPAGKVRGYGQTAWIDGAGRIPLPRGTTRVVVTADPQLPPAARLQIEAVEVESP